MNWEGKAKAGIMATFSGNSHDRRVAQRAFVRLFWWPMLRARLLWRWFPERLLIPGGSGDWLHDWLWAREVIDG